MKNKIIFTVLMPWLLLGCHNKVETTAPDLPETQERTSVNSQETDSTQINQKSDISILRYKVDSRQPVFASGRTYGYLSIENSCLVIKQQDHVYALALPISDDDSQWQTKWDDANQALVFEGSTYPLGSYLDLGGGGMGHEQVISNTSACQKYNIFGAFNLTLE